MTHIQKAHIDWIKEVCAEHKNRDRRGLEFICNVEEIVKLCENKGGEKIKGICESLRNPKSKYSKITGKQRFAIATFLLSEFESMYEVVAEAWSISLEEAMAEVE